MNGPIWVAWVLFAILSVLSTILLTGKGSFLVAGFNTLSKEQKQRYNKKRLSRIFGGGLSIITIILGISIFYRFELPTTISWLIPWGILLTILTIIILGNTLGRKKQ